MEEIEELKKEEYQDYIDFMYEFTNYHHTLKEIPNIPYIIVMKKEGKIIGAGSLYKLYKLHNNPVGQIEDVMITETYRGKGYGKKLIEKLVEMGKRDCYKVILNCLDKNIGFYEKCGFYKNGNEMRI
jgi:glucosamine-phosphate N-acetyltransferase